MVSVTIEPADNGVVKVVYDDSVNGAGEEYISRKVYDFEEDPTKRNVVKFLDDLTLDLGIDIGSELDDYVVKITSDWGDPLAQNEEDIKKRISLLKEEIKKLQSYLK